MMSINYEDSAWSDKSDLYILNYLFVEAKLNI